MNYLLFASKVLKGHQVREISKDVKALKRLGKHDEAIAIIMRQASNNYALAFNEDRKEVVDN